MHLLMGLRHIYGVLDNLFYWDLMLEFKTLLSQFHFPFPFLSAILSVYAQLIAGLMTFAGWKIRLSALVMVINFLVALLIIQWDDSLKQMTPPLALLFSSLLFIFYSAGSYSLGRESTPASVILNAQKDHRNIEY